MHIITKIIDVSSRTTRYRRGIFFNAKEPTINVD